MKRKIIAGIILIVAILSISAYALMSVHIKVASPSGNVLKEGEVFDLFINVTGNNNNYAGIQLMLNISNASVINISEAKGGRTGYDLNGQYNGSYYYSGNSSQDDLFYPNKVFFGIYNRSYEGVPGIGFFHAMTGNHSFTGSGTFARFKVRAMQKGDVFIDLTDVMISDQSGLFPILPSTEGIHLTVIGSAAGGSCGADIDQDGTTEYPDLNHDSLIDQTDQDYLQFAIDAGTTCSGDCGVDIDQDGTTEYPDLNHDSLIDQTDQDYLQFAIDTGMTC